MRLDARTGDAHWDVWHCREMCQLKFVVWVDDATAEYCELAHSPCGVVLIFNDELMLIVHRAHKIEIYTKQRLVLIDPIEGEEDHEISRCRELVVVR